MDEATEGAKGYISPIALQPSRAVFVHSAEAHSDLVITRQSSELGRCSLLGRGALFSVGVPMVDHLVVKQGPARIRLMSTARLIKLLAFVDEGRRVAIEPLHPAPLHVFLDLPDTCESDDDIVRWFVGRLASASRSLDATLHLIRGSESYQLIRFLLAAAPLASVDQLGETYGLSPSHFRRKCQAALGRPLKLELRILRAARSLLDTSHRPRSFTRIAEDHGFASSAHFSSDIKGLTGLCPSEIYERKICGQ